MKKYLVILLEQAEADIDAQAQWWADHYSASQAVRWFEAVHDQLQMLEMFPESHALSEENDEFSFEIRDRLVGLGRRTSHRAVFTIQGDSVYVLAVRSAAQGRLRPTDVGFPT